MKKLLSIGLLAAAGMLLAVSCSNDELDSAVRAGDEVTVTFNLVQPGISTRATTYSTGTKATALTYAVYETGSKTPLITSQDADAVAVTFTNLEATLNLTLVSGKTYDILFWADNGTGSPYTFSATDQTITVDYTDVKSQDESRDAFFYALKGLYVDGAINKEVTLTRPFAQLNIGTTDLTEAKQAGFTPTYSKVTITPTTVYNTLNLYSGEVSNASLDATTLTYDLATIPTDEDFPVTVSGSTITYLSMNYLLVNSKELVDVEFTVNNSTGTEEEAVASAHSIPLTFASVPIQRNYRTNIYGTLLTDPANFTIVIAPDYEEPDYIVPEYVADATELAAALADSEICEIALSTDMTISTATDITSDKTIDLNGYTLTSSGDFTATSGTTLTIQDGTINQTDGASLCCVAGGSIVIDNVTYSGTGWSCVFSAQNAENTSITIRNSNITGGYYALTTNATTNPVGSTVMTLENSTFTALESAFLINVPSTVTATGCTFQSGWQAVFLRGGTSSFTNCEFNLVMDPEYGDVPEDHKNATTGYWASGNQAEGAILLIGNYGAENSTAYNYPTTVTLSNCKFSVSGTAKSTKTERTAAQTPSVYVWSRIEDGNGTTITYDAASYESFEAAGSGSYVGNEGANLTVNGSAYSYTAGNTSLPAVN